MNRREALQLIESKICQKNLIKHMLAVEACMRRLAREFGEDEETWGLAGLLHDLDYELTKDDFSRHGIVTAEILEAEGLCREITDAIKAHPGHQERSRPMAKALYAADPLTGLIVASALMHPQKKLGALDISFLLNRYKEKGFARGANREQIAACEELGLPLEEFVRLCLEAMNEISRDLGL